jgi:hypothetical protein
LKGKTRLVEILRHVTPPLDESSSATRRDALDASLTHVDSPCQALGP